MWRGNSGRKSFVTGTFALVSPMASLARYITSGEKGIGITAAVMVLVVLIALWAVFAEWRATNLGMGRFSKAVYIPAIIGIAVCGTRLFSFHLVAVLGVFLALQLPLFLLPERKSRGDLGRAGTG